MPIHPALCITPRTPAEDYVLCLNLLLACKIKIAVVDDRAGLQELGEQMHVIRQQLDVIEEYLGVVCGGVASRLAGLHMGL